jgi:beta-1,4-mannosyl-glycoprotein beta-1,4-N-acetylglucosaminyltransferase
LIIDCFPFFNELDLLEIRLNALAPYVGRFVLCEMPVTHSGNSKPLFFEQNKDRYKNFPITHIIAPPKPDMRIEMGRFSGDAWRLEHWQRECLMDGIRDADPEDIILLSDLDEIPDLDNYRYGDEGAFKQELYYYYFNCHVNQRRHWKGTIAIRRKNIVTLTHTRNMRNKYPTIVLWGGWHFSTMGSPEDIVYKIESFAHTELNREEFKSKIAENRAALKDMYARGASNFWPDEFKLTIEMPSGPKWLLENKDRYPKYWYGKD